MEILRLRKQRKTHKFKSKVKNNSGFNFNTQIRKFKKHCRFCQVDGHISDDCTIFATYQQRINRCGVKKLCVQCTSPDHIPGPYCPASKKGPGGLYKVCKYSRSDNHVASLCKNKKSAVPVQNNVCLSTNIGQKSNFLLPILSITFKGRSGRVATFNALVDTGSCRSYINPRVADLLGVGLSSVNQVHFDVSTFLGCGEKKLGETCLVSYLPSGRYLNVSMYVDPTFNLNLEVRGLQQLITNLQKLNYNLGADFTNNSDKIPIDGLLGNDIIQFIKFDTIPCMNGQAFLVSDKIVPFGNSAHFLYPSQMVGHAVNDHVENNYSTILSNVKCADHIVNNCLEPKVFYEDGLAPLFDDSAVERNIEKIVNCDALATN